MVLFALREIAGVSDIAISPDGNSLYAIAGNTVQVRGSINGTIQGTPGYIVIVDLAAIGILGAPPGAAEHQERAIRLLAITATIGW
ncbi:MAG: hypothetical protein HC881_21230 [Leptolyngbyaceae cyanobacterium SL_7_1]|nr:hypothetical protein [Leptolyngbyaceae cyanobacterium SL_7_1]